MIDDTVVDPFVAWRSGSVGPIRRLKREVGFAARGAEARKRTAIIKVGPYKGQKLGDVLENLDLDFFPLGFELTGAPGRGWAIFLKKISRIAHDRRGHNRAAFCRKWKQRISLAIVKRGAQVAIRKAADIAAIRADGDPIAAAAADGPLTGNEPPLCWNGGDYASLGQAGGGG